MTLIIGKALPTHAKDTGIPELLKLCGQCEHYRVGVDGYVGSGDRVQVVLRHACMKPAQQDKELRKVQKELFEREDKELAAARKRLLRTDLPRLQKDAGPDVISEVLVRMLDRFGLERAGPTVEVLLAGDLRGAELLEKWSDRASVAMPGKTRTEVRQLLETRTRALYKSDPRKLALLLAITSLEDNTFSLELLADVVTRRLELVGVDADQHKLERIQKGSTKETQDDISTSTEAECQILLGRLEGTHGSKSKIAAVKRRLKTFEKPALKKKAAPKRKAKAKKHVNPREGLTMEERQAKVQKALAARGLMPKKKGRGG